MTLLESLKNGEKLSLKQQLLLIIQLSVPAIFAQISSIIMEYIDASMVGHLGKNATASIGLVSSTTWLIGGICMAVCMGFTVQIAQLIGAKNNEEARQVMKQGLVFSLSFSICVSIIGLLIAKQLPVWLGGDISIQEDATKYFQVFLLFLPLFQLNRASAGMLQGSGNMKTPSILHIIMCFLDVVLNCIFIFPYTKLGPIVIPGLNMKVMGAALGTGLSELIIGVIMVYILLTRSKELKLRKNEPLHFHSTHITKAIKIAAPIGLENILLSGAQIISTLIVSPLGSVAIASHSLAITVESLGYMPGYGIGSASTTLIGQSIGAKRYDLTKRLGYLCTIFGTVMMAVSGLLLYLFSPYLFLLLTPVKEIQILGTEVLRIEAFAEGLYGTSIVANGVFRGTGDTLQPSLLNFLSMWCIRLPLAYYLSLTQGLRGVWLAMCIELCIRGLLFFIRLIRNKWVPVA